MKTDRTVTPITDSRIAAPRPSGEANVPHTVRVPDARWEAASVIAKSEGLDISKVINHYLQHYIDTAPELHARKA